MSCLQFSYLYTESCAFCENSMPPRCHISSEDDARVERERKRRRVCKRETERKHQRMGAQKSLKVEVVTLRIETLR